MSQSRVVMFAVGFLGLALAGCATKPQPAAESAPEKGGSSASAGVQQVTLRVEGMAKILGITWLGWPNRVEEALAGLPGIAALQADLKKDLFHVRYDPMRVTPERMLEAVRTQGFRGVPVEGASPTLAPAPGQRNLTRLPDDLQKAVQEARGEGKPLLLAFHGPDWLPCQRMGAVTYPNAEVKNELARWVVRHVDVAERRDVAELLEVVGVPAAVALTAGGQELGRVEGFVEPGGFRARLEQLRSRSGRK